MEFLPHKAGNMANTDKKRNVWTRVLQGLSEKKRTDFFRAGSVNHKDAKPQRGGIQKSFESW